LLSTDDIGVERKLWISYLALCEVRSLCPSAEDAEMAAARQSLRRRLDPDRGADSGAAGDRRPDLKLVR
jgi:hypothetical protein